MTQTAAVPNAPETPPATTPPAVPPAATPPATPPASNVVWPDQWRQTFANGDDNEVKQLERYASPVDVWRKARSLEQRMSSGELRAVTKFPEGGTPEQQAAWRTENGIPVSADKYDVKLNGFEVDEDMKPMVDDFLKSAHAAHMPPALVNSSLQWLFDYDRRDGEAEAVRIKDLERKSEDDLRAAWGADYRPNLNAIQGLLAGAPEGIKDALYRARMADGTPLGNHAGILQFLADVARKINPVSTLIPNSGGNPKALDDEIASIEKTMRENRGAYNADEKMQARYRDLLSAREKIKATG